MPDAPKEPPLVVFDEELVQPDQKEGSSASYPALPVTQNEQRFFFATMPVEDIFPYCYVVSRYDDAVEGFQRELNKERALDIAHYLDDSKGSIPTNIVLSAQAVAELSYNSKSKTIKYRRKPHAFLVLDGQHRLYGYGLTKKHHRVPVAIYEGLSRQQEAKLFIDINTTQRGVPAALLLDIKQLAQQETETETRKRTLFDKLATDPASPFNGLLSSAKSAPGKISRVAFYRGAAFLLNNKVVVKLDETRSYTLIRNYFKAVEQSLKKPKLLRKAAYFEAFAEFFVDALDACRSKHGDYKLTSMLETLGPIQNIDLETIPTGGKTLITKAVILPVLRDAVETELEVSGDMV
jgi:DGQHR domain-containing protein